MAEEDSSVAMSGTSTSVLMEEVKKNIRALLISAPRGLSVDDIEHDYRAMLGKPMPFKQFKCSNCLEFLKTIPDVVSPSWVNGSLILRGIILCFCLNNNYNYKLG